MNNEKDNTVFDKKNQLNDNITVSDTQAIDTKQLKELSSNIVSQDESNTENITKETNQNIENSSDNTSENTVSIENYSKNKTTETIPADNNQEASANTDEFDSEFDDDFVEGQLNMFDDEDDFTTADDEIEETSVQTSQYGYTDNSNSEDKGEKFEFHFSIPSKVKKGLFIAALLFVTFFVSAYVVGYTTLPTNTIYKNLYIENINVGGMTQEQALKRISDASLLHNQDINISYLTKNFTIDGDAISLEASLEATAKKAYNYGKTGNKYIDALHNTMLLFSRHTIKPAVNIDTAKLDEYITKFGNQCLGELKQHNIVVQADGLVYIGPGQTGYNNDVKSARKTILEALANDRFSDIKLHLSTASPDTLTLEKFDAAVYCDPVDSYYDYSNGDVMVIAETVGRYINKEEAAPLLKRVHEGGKPVYIPWYRTEPKITAQMMQEKLFNTTLASFSTYYGGTYNRNRNVENAAAKLNGAVIPPGEVFSFNDRVGPRTVANGFFSAPEYANGQTVQGIGGGTCQVSTTLYGAVLYADMDIVDRTEHMFAVGYTKLGQDATVAYGSLDFKFRNSSDYPVKIVATTSGGKITVNILGTAWDPPKKVVISHSGGSSYVSSRRLIYDQNGTLIETEILPSSSYKQHE